MSIVAKSLATGLILVMVAITHGAFGAKAGEPKSAGWASVRADGEMLRAKGVSKVTRKDTGSYTIKFDRAVRNCAYFVQIANPEEATFVLGLTTAVHPDGGKRKRVKLVIYDTASRVAFDHGFFVHAYC